MEVGSTGKNETLETSESRSVEFVCLSYSFGVHVLTSLKRQSIGELFE